MRQCLMLKLDQPWRCGMNRTNVYIDGFNLFYGASRGRRVQVA